MSMENYGWGSAAGNMMAVMMEFVIGEVVVAVLVPVIRRWQWKITLKLKKNEHEIYFLFPLFTIYQPSRIKFSISRLLPLFSAFFLLSQIRDSMYLTLPFSVRIIAVDQISIYLILIAVTLFTN